MRYTQRQLKAVRRKKDKTKTTKGYWFRRAAHMAETQRQHLIGRAAQSLNTEVELTGAIWGDNPSGIYGERHRQEQRDINIAMSDMVKSIAGWSLH